MTEQPSINVSALICFRNDTPNKELLFVKAYNKQHYGFPGGKIEPGESPEAALVREVDEEINARLENIQKRDIVKGHTPEGRGITMHIFSADLATDIAVGAEINEIRWLTLDQIKKLETEMTPVTRDLVMPIIESEF